MQAIDTPHQLPDPMTVLQNRWYNGFVAGLQVDRTQAEIIQPSLPLHTDNDLWAYENRVPPASLTFNTNLCGNEQFFEEYAALASRLLFPQSTFQQDIGADTYQAWTHYVNALQPPPTLEQLPALFMGWAMQFAPQVAQIGTSDLTQMALIAASQQMLAPYIGPHALPVDFDGSLAQLLHMLSQMSGVEFSFDSNTRSSDVSNTWTGGRDTNMYGLWTGSSSRSRLSLLFAHSKVTVTVSAKRYMVWRSTPGSWYDSSLLNNAFSNTSSPPWPANGNPNWNNFFGPTGSMRQVIASLLMMDGMHVSVASDATYTHSDQQSILGKVSAGLWPFFIPDSDSVVTNQVTFGSPSGMNIETITQPGNPMVVGANVLSIARYLGHATA
jgi:hypothetical protein